MFLTEKTEENRQLERIYGNISLVKVVQNDLSQKCHVGHQEGGVTINDDTGVTLTEFPDI